MNPRRTVAFAAAVCLPLVLMGQGCDTDASTGKGKTSPKVMKDGNHTVTKAMRGFWKSAGGPKCQWGKVDRYGNPSGDGKGNQDQSVMFGSADVGGIFLSKGCTVWSQK